MNRAFHLPIAACLILPLLLAGCHRAATGTSPLTAAAALEHLSGADTAGFVKAEHCGIPINLSATQSDTGMRWAVMSEGEQVAGFTVTLAPADSGSTATIAIPADPAGGEIYDGGKHYDRPAVHQPLRPAVQELVDAALAGRPFDATHIGDQGGDGLCSIQRNAADSGSGHFSIHDKPAPGPGQIDVSGAGNAASAALTAYSAPMLTPEQQAVSPDAGRETQ